MTRMIHCFFVKLPSARCAANREEAKSEDRGPGQTAKSRDRHQHCSLKGKPWVSFRAEPRNPYGQDVEGWAFGEGGKLK